MFTIDELYELSQEEMIELVLDLQDDIYSLENNIKELKQERTNKITQDYNDYRNMVSSLLIGVIK